VRRGSTWARSIWEYRKGFSGDPPLTSKEIEIRRQKRREERARAAKLRAESWERCHWCGVEYGDTGNDRRTKEHLIPRSLGGSDDLVNIVFAHRSCNSQRGNSMAWIPFHVHQQAGKVVWK